MYRELRIRADGGFAGEHDRVGSVVDGVRHIGHLCACGVGMVDHRVEHVGRDDHGAECAVAGLHDLLLQVRHRCRIDLHAQIATSNHDGIRSFDDLVDVLDRLSVLDLRHDIDVRAAVFVEEGADRAHVFRAAHE